MLRIYLIVSIFSQFFPADSARNSWSEIVGNLGPSQISVSFQEHPEINVGSPVLAEGQLIGKVNSINPAGTGTFSVEVKIAPNQRMLLRQGTIALISSPLSASRLAPETVVELLLPSDTAAPVLAEGETIVGYSSFEQFWSAS